MVLAEILPIETALQRENGPVSYEEFAGPLCTPPRPPCFVLGTLPGYLAPDLFGQTEIGGVGCYRLREAQLTFDAIILQRGAALCSLALNHPRNHVQAVMSAQAAGWAGLPVRRIAGQAAILHGPGFDIFGHWLIDFLPRLYGVHLAGLDIETIPFILPHATPAFARCMLKQIGIPDQNLIWHDQLGERIEADELVVPTLFRHRSRFHPFFGAATQFWRNRVSRTADMVKTGLPTRRIFVSRSRVSSARHLRDRATIEARAAAAGYDIVCPETLSLSQQISLFGSATHIMGEYGSGLHGSIFAPPGTVMCAMRGTSHHPGFAQSGLAERFDHTIGYVFGETPEHAGDHSFSIDQAAFENALSLTEAWASRQDERAQG
jgi:capsular polysaccharide biosynthesis protein